MSVINDFFLNLPLPVLDHWGYLILFLLALVEALPVFGAFLPGHTLIMLGGYLVYLGIFRLDATISVAFGGAFIGDLLAYIIGRKFGHDFLARYGKYFFLNQARYEKTKELVQKHAGKTLIIGRFVSFARAMSAFTAGISRVKFSKFIFFACLSGAAWASSAVLIGYVFGQGFEVAAKYFGRFILLAFIAIVSIIFSYYFLNKNKHIFVKYHIFYLILNGLSIYLFCKMVEDYFAKESVYRFDLWLEQNIQQIWQPGLIKPMILVSQIFSPATFFSIALAAAIYFFVKQERYKASLIFMSVNGGLILSAILKRLINRPRPVDGLVLETGLSFPSGHALAALTFFALVLLFFTRKIGNRWLSYLFAFINIFLIILVGFSRIYLRAHWFSDVVAGYALGLFWLTLLILAFRIIKQLRGGSAIPPPPQR
jgi:undecaprenyl-diphosphatase